MIADLQKEFDAWWAETLPLMVNEDVPYAPHQPQARTLGSNVAAVGPEDGIVAFPRYFNLRASSIAGGSNEVQKNIVAKLVLGL